MNKLLSVVAIAVALLSGSLVSLHADENAFFKAGPLELNIPLKVGRVAYLYDFKATQNLVGAETPVVRLFDRLEGTVGVVTSLEGKGTGFLGGNILIGNLLQKWVTLPEDFNIGGFGGYNFTSDAPLYGLKASLKIWG